MTNSLEPLLIGLTGRAGAGKDTCAQLLEQYGFHALAFADALRAEVADAWCIDQRLLMTRETKEMPMRELSIGRCGDRAFVNIMDRVHARGMSSSELCAPRSPRWIMQRWGTEYRRAQSVSYWTDILSERVQALRRTAPVARIVVSDVRFPNEAACVRELGGTILVVHRPPGEWVLDMPPNTAAHVSEVLLPGDGTVVNDGDGMADLQVELRRALTELTGRRGAWHQADAARAPAPGAASC